jgi:hypothetical protein
VTKKGEVGGTLAAPVVVRVIDRHGNAVPGVDVRAQTAAESEGSVSPDETSTDPDGLASFEWTLGPTEGAQEFAVEPSGWAGTGITVMGTATDSRTVGNYSIVSGDSQEGQVTTEADDPLVVRMTDDSGDPFSGRTVQWTVEDGDATLAK